jgi:hypothetical protein
MAESLNLFPQRAPIGRADARGLVYMTDEFTRALAALLLRVGGANGTSAEDVAVELAVGPVTALAGTLVQAVADLELQVQLESYRAQLAEAHKELAALRAEMGEAAGLFAALAEVRKSLAEVQLLGVDPPRPTDWEHPGKIGARTRNSGAFTSLAARTAPYSTPAAGNTATFDTNGTNAVSVQFGGDEATGYTWQRNIQQNVGAVPHRHYLYNTLVMTLTTGGASVNGNVSATGQLVSTVATGTPPFSVLSTTMVPNLKSRYALEADGLTNPSPLPPAATDLATCITLANALRTAAANKGL